MSAKPESMRAKKPAPKKKPAKGKPTTSERALTDKQRRFVDEYLINLNGRQAAIRAGYSVNPQEAPPAGLFYCYVLCNPSTGRLFYVGKGSGRRAWVHSKEAEAGRIINARKHRAIREILASGRAVSVVIVGEYQNEAESLQAEAELIRALDTPDLTNISQLRGAPDGYERLAAEAQDLLDRMKPFDQWVGGMSAQQAANTDRHLGGPRFFYDYCIRELAAMSRMAA